MADGITINTDAMTLGDLETLEQVVNMESGAIGKFFGMLERISNIGDADDIRDLPLSSLSDVAAAITDAVNKAAQEGN